MQHPWLDFGCGPGLITIAAAARGYDALGIDRDPAMVTAARRSARRQQSTAVFEQGDVTASGVAPAAVVSAASLLAVVSDPAAALQHLWAAVARGGALLVVETTSAMTPNTVRAFESNVAELRSRTALRMWANARHGRAVDPTIAAALAGATVERVPLIADMVELWAIRRTN